MQQELTTRMEPRGEPEWIPKEYIEKGNLNGQHAHDMFIVCNCSLTVRYCTKSYQIQIIENSNIQVKTWNYYKKYKKTM